LGWQSQLGDCMDLAADQMAERGLKALIRLNGRKQPIRDFRTIDSVGDAAAEARDCGFP
jgi:hypothetical protein